MCHLGRQLGLGSLCNLVSDLAAGSCPRVEGRASSRSCSQNLSAAAKASEERRLQALVAPLFLKSVCLFVCFREGGREGERERNTDVREKHRSIASHMRPDWGPRYVP